MAAKQKDDAVWDEDEVGQTEDKGKGGGHHAFAE